MAFDTYIKLTDIDGEAQDNKHKDWIEVMSYKHNMQQPPSASVSSMGGATVGRVDMDDFEFVKGVDKASPKLYEACCKGTHIASATVEMCRASQSDPVVFMKIEMTDVLVSQVTPSGDGKAADGFPTEKVTLNFGKITWTYTQQKRQGGAAAGQVQTSWNLAKHASA